MMTKRRLRRADLIASPLLLLISGAAVWSGLRMPMGGTYAGRPVYWYTSPGLFPVLVGSFIFLCSLGVLRRAIADQAHLGWRHRLARLLRRGVRSRTSGRVGIVWALIGGYIAALALNPFGPLSALIENRVWAQTVWTRFLTEPDGVNYMLTTFLFLSVMTLAFHRPARGPTTWKGRALIVGSLALLSWGVSCVFTEILLTPLP